MGEITADQARALGQPAGEIRARYAAAQHLVHKHGDALAALGFDSPEAMIEAIAGGFTRLERGSGASVRIVREGTPDGILIANWKPSDTEAWEIASGFARGRPGTKEPLWSAARHADESLTTAGQPTVAGSEPRQGPRAITDPQGLTENLDEARLEREALQGPEPGPKSSLTPFVTPFVTTSQ